jgi:hypothetical protein
VTNHIICLKWRQSQNGYLGQGPHLPFREESNGIFFEEAKKMSRMVGLIIVTVLVLSACHGSVFLVDTRPDLNRHFRLGIDQPGEWPYCRQYEEESELQIQMYGY